MSRLRIAQFAESFSPVINGAAVAVAAITEALREQHEVVVFAPRFPGHPDSVDVERFPSYRLPGHADYPLAIPCSPGIWTRFRARQFDVVHTHSPFALGKTGLAWGRRLGIPVVTTYHTLYVDYAHYARGVPQSWARAWLRRLSRQYCTACDGVATPSAPVADLLRSYGVPDPIAVIPTGLGPATAPAQSGAALRARFGIPVDAPLVVYAGRLAREKNLELLFDAFAQAAVRLPTARMLIAGSGPEERHAHYLAQRSGVGERIAFAGFLPPESMPQLYASADVFLFTSLTDTQGLVLTEAKAYGLPAVAVDAYGPGTVVANEVDGLLAPADAEKLADALLRVLTDRDLAARLRSGALQRAGAYRIEATAAAYVELYLAAQVRRAQRGRDGMGRR